MSLHPSPREGAAAGRARPGARRTFGQGLAFAAIAALVAPVLWHGLAPAAGGWLALRLCVLGLAGAYAVFLAGRTRQRLEAALVAGALAWLALLIPASTAVVALCGAAIVAVVRSGLVYRCSGRRAFLVEALLGGGGLLLAGYLDHGGALGLAMGVWGYFLVQSIYFVIGGIQLRGRGDRRRSVDAFEAARARLERLLEEGPAR